MRKYRVCLSCIVVSNEKTYDFPVVRAFDELPLLDALLGLGQRRKAIARSSSLGSSCVFTITSIAFLVAIFSFVSSDHSTVASTS